MEPDPAAQTRLDHRLTRRLRAARLVLAWEAAWAVGWPLVSLTLLFLGLAFLDLPARLPGWLHCLLLLGFGLALVVCLIRLRHFRLPGRDQAARRLERDSGLPHRPLDLLDDHLSTGPTAPGEPTLSRDLWITARTRARLALTRLRLAPPDPVLPRHDVWGLRFIPLILLFIAAFSPDPLSWRQVQLALSPDLPSLFGADPVLQVWITPPAYTGQPPLLLDPTQPPPKTAIGIPTGSALLAQLQGGHGRATLLIDDQKIKFNALEANGTSQKVEATLTEGRELDIRQGWHSVAHWKIAIILDQPPSVALTDTPQSDAQGRLRLDLEAHDDYGVAKVWAEITRPGLDHNGDGAPDPVLTAPITLDRPHPTDIRQTAWQDLTGHPWAGLPVVLRLVAQDGAGQTSETDPISLVLPERHFTHPVAQAIIAQRKDLASSQEPQQLDKRQLVIDALGEIASDPDAFDGDITVFLALVSAQSRLAYDLSPSSAPEVLDLLWQAALRIEDGDVASAEKVMEDAQKALQDALNSDAPEAEIDRLTNQLKDAMAHYLDSLAEQAQRQGNTAPPDPNAQILSGDDLTQMLDQMRDLSRTGSRQAAQQTLSQLRQMMDGLRSAMHQPQNADQVRKARQNLEELQAITQQQRDLLDRTFRRNQQSQHPPSALSWDEDTAETREQDGKPTPDSKADQQRQLALKARLDTLLKSIEDMTGSVPQSLGQATQAMGDAAQALGKQRLIDAQDAQSEALTRLQEGADQAGQSMSEKLGTSLMLRPGGQGGRDPLGRRPGNSGNGADANDVKIPTQPQMQKAREILDELRKRSGQGERPGDERDYLQRLLKPIY